VGSLFGGVGPFALIMAKKQKAVSKIYSIELNPEAHQFALGNVVLNKLQDKVEAILMDAVQACNTVSIFFPPRYQLSTLLSPSSVALFSSSLAL
jgi:tRNA G37 N-methylase Trm5